MKKMALLLLLALFLSLCACNSNDTNSTGITASVSVPSVSMSPNTTTQAQPTPNYTLEDLIIAKAVEMATLTGLRTNSEFLKLYTTSDEVIKMAQSFSSAATEDPIQAYGFCIGDADMTFLINNATNRFGNSALVCTSVLMHNTQINMQEQLSEAIAIGLKYSEDCYILVTFTPVQGNIAYVQAYAILPEVAEELINAAYFDVDSMTAEQITHSCTVAANVSCRYGSNVAVADAEYYEQLAQSVLYRIPLEKIQDVTETIRPYVEHYSHHFTDTPQKAYVYQFSSKAQQLIADEYNIERIEDSQLRDIAVRDLLAATPKRMASIYGEQFVVVNTIFHGVAQPLFLDGTPKQQTQPVIVVFVYDDDTVCMVCVYGNEYGLLQYTFACLPELPENWGNSNLADAGLERMD